MCILNEVMSPGEVYSSPRVIDYLTKLQFWYGWSEVSKRIDNSIGCSWMWLTDDNTDYFMAMAC